MAAECISIIIVLLLVIYQYIRLNKWEFAVALLPLLLLPAVHIAGIPLSRITAKALGVERVWPYLLLDVLATVIACILFGVSAMKLKPANYRITYLICCAGFTAILASILAIQVFLRF